MSGEASGGIISPRIAIYNNILTYGNGIVIDVFDQDNVQVTSTSPTILFSIPTPITEQYVVWVYARVVTSNTNTTLTLTWTDESGPQSSTLTSGGFAVGAHPLPPTYIRALAGTAITLSITIDHANQVFITTDVNLM